MNFSGKLMELGNNILRDITQIQVIKMYAVIYKSLDVILTVCENCRNQKNTTLPLPG